MHVNPKGNRLAIITNAGGPGILATDYLMEQGGQLPTLSEETVYALNQVLSFSWSHKNPIDILGDATRRIDKYCMMQRNGRPDDGRLFQSIVVLY